ncbi:hypothetical protein H0H81_007136, partial [Sphagnurus paluster]
YVLVTKRRPNISEPKDEAGPRHQERSEQHNLLSELKRAKPDYSHFVETSHCADDADGDPSRFSSKEEDVSSRLTSLPESEELPLPPCRRAYVEDVPNEGDTVLTRAQTAVVQEAHQSMTEAKRRLVDTRNHVVNNIDLHVNSAFLERDNPGDSSRAKGKTVDPCNWGDADLSGDELDLDVQAQILEACNLQCDSECPDDPEDEDWAPEVSEEPVIRGPSDEDIAECLRFKEQLEANIQCLQDENNRLKKKQKTQRHDGSEPASQEMVQLIDNIVHRKKDKKKATKEKSGRGIQPISQVAGDSSLGKAFQRLQEEDDPSSSDESSRPSLDESDSPSDSESEHSSDSGSLASSSHSSLSSGSHCRLHRHRSKKRKSMIRRLPV